MAGEDEIEGGNRDEEQIHYNSANLSADWPFNGTNELTNTSMSNPMSNIWDHHPTSSQNLGAFCDGNLQNNPTTSSSSLGFRKGNLLVPQRSLDMGWAPPDSAIKRGGMFLPPAASAMLPHSLSHFPADSGFIERVAMLSSFSAGNFEDMINPFGNVNDSSLSPYSSRSVQGQAQEGFVGNGFKSASGDGSKDMPLPVDCGANDGSQPKQGGSGFSGNNGTGEAEYSEGGGQDEILMRVLAQRKDEEVISFCMLEIDLVFQSTEDDFDLTDIAHLLPDSIDADEETLTMEAQHEQFLLAAEMDRINAYAQPANKQMPANGLELEVKPMRVRSPKSPVETARYWEKPAKPVSPKSRTNRIQQPR